MLEAEIVLAIWKCTMLMVGRGDAWIEFHHWIILVIWCVCTNVMDIHIYKLITDYFFKDNKYMEV